MAEKVTKKGKKPYKFRQARKDAKPAAKKTFSGKARAGLKDKDPNTKLTTIDKEALDELKKSAKEKGRKSPSGEFVKMEGYQDPKEFRAAQKAEREKFRSSMRAEFGEYGGKKATATDLGSNPKLKERAPKPAPKPTIKGKGMNKTRTFVQATEVKPQSKVLKKKPAQGVGGTAGTVAKPKAGLGDQIKKDVAKVNANKPSRKTFKSKKTFGQISKAVTEKTAPKPATKGFAAGKTLTPKGQEIYDDLIKQGVKPKSALNKALYRQEKSTGKKPSLPKMSVEEMKAQNKKALDGLKKDIESTKKASAPKQKGVVEMRGKKMTPAQADKEAKKIQKVEAVKPKTKKPSVKKPSAKSASTASKVGKAALGAAKTTATVVGPGKFLKAGALIKGAFAANKAVKVTKAAKAAESGKKLSAANTARKAANAEKAAKVAKMSKGKKALRNVAIGGALYGIGALPIGGGSKKSTSETTARPQRPAGSYPKGGGKGMKLGPNVQVNAGGSTTSYEVKKGDTLSGIAKTSGVKLSEILAANPKIADKKSKYKGGSMIWSGTKVKIPTKK